MLHSIYGMLLFLAPFSRTAGISKHLPSFSSYRLFPVILYIRDLFDFIVYRFVKDFECHFILFVRIIWIIFAFLQLFVYRAYLILTFGAVVSTFILSVFYLKLLN